MKPKAIKEDLSILELGALLRLQQIISNISYKMMNQPCPLPISLDEMAEYSNARTTLIKIRERIYAERMEG